MSTYAPTKTLTAREYLRVSQQGSGDTSSTDEQHAENAAVADQEGWSLHPDPYRDVDRSASRYATKVREGYDELMADLSADRFGAEVLMLWESSRGSRKVSEWVALLELLEERGVLVYVTFDERLYNPANARDRKTLLNASVDNEFESAQTSGRVRRTAARQAAAGKPNGRVPWGYRRDYEFVTVNGKQKRIIHQVPDEDAAPLIRELFDSVKAGRSLRGIANDWAARGITNRSGRPFSAAHLRSLLMTRAYAGQRIHNPGSRNANAARQGIGKVHEGDWESLVDRATFTKVQAILNAPERRTSRPGRGIHLLSMIAVCDVCDGPLGVTYRKRPEGEYACLRGGHVRVRKVEVDRLGEDAMLAFLARPDAYGPLLDAEADNPALAKAQEKVQGIQLELDDLGDQVGSGALSATLAARAEPDILVRLKAAQEQAKALETPSRLRDLIEPGPGVEARWGSAPMSVRREVARLLLSPEAMGELRIMRRPRNSGARVVPVEDRVTWGPTGDR